MKKRYLALVAALALAVGGVVGGTLAWLTAETDPVVNTFTPSDINITLTETPGQTYKMIPGWTITKDPKVTVNAGSEECWLFVKLDKSPNFGTYMTYEMAEGWTQGDGVDIPDNVYYREIDSAGEMGQAYSVLKEDKVTVKDTVTKEDMNVLTQEDDYPTLTVTAYASQLYKNENKQTFTAPEAWTNISTPTP